MLEQAASSCFNPSTMICILDFEKIFRGSPPPPRKVGGSRARTPSWYNRHHYLMNFLKAHREIQTPNAHTITTTTQLLPLASSTSRSATPLSFVSRSPSSLPVSRPWPKPGPPRCLSSRDSASFTSLSTLDDVDDDDFEEEEEEEAVLSMEAAMRAVAWVDIPATASAIDEASEGDI